MAEDKSLKENIYSANDALDINELASLNDDISPEFIEQLQNQVAMNASKFTGKDYSSESLDAELFEEVFTQEETQVTENETVVEEVPQEEEIVEEKAEIQATEITQTNAEPPAINNTVEVTENKEIENLTSGNITEKPVNKTQLDYTQELDYLDDNVKYTKYIVYVNPENTEFIESLTVKERKNLINRLLREQDDIAITKRRLALAQTIIKHSIIAIITIAITIPLAYWTINASLEASINNYRRSKVMFKTLYKEKGKIKTNTQY